MKALVLAARGLQAAYVGCYGNPWIMTPNLDALAAEGVVFDRHFADRADGAGARLTWRDGRHHLPDPSRPAGPVEMHANLIDQLRERGVHTCLIADESRAAESGFETGWREVRRAASFDAVLAEAADALGRLAGRDGWLLWVDLAPLIPPWETPEELLAPYFQEEPGDDEDEDESEVPEEPEEEEEPLTPLTGPPPGPIDPADDLLFVQLQASYAGAVSRLDGGLGPLLERLVALNPGDDVLIVCTADHGLALGEHGAAGPDAATAHAEATQLPLILRLPAADEAGRRVEALTQAADLAATLADVFEAPLPSAQGRSLLPLVYGEAEAVRPYVCSGAGSGDASEWSLRTPEWSLILPSAGAPRLYVRPDDRWEVNDVVQHHLERAEGLERTLRGFVEATRRPGPLTAPPLPEENSGEKEAMRADES